MKSQYYDFLTLNCDLPGSRNIKPGSRYNIITPDSKSWFRTVKPRTIRAVRMRSSGALELAHGKGCGLCYSYILCTESLSRSLPWPNKRLLRDYGDKKSYVGMGAIF